MAKETKSAKTSFEGKKVKPQDKVKVVVTNSKFHEPGTIVKIHPMQAEKWIADGKAAKYENDDQAKSLGAKKTKDKTNLEKNLGKDIEDITNL